MLRYITAILALTLCTLTATAQDTVWDKLNKIDANNKILEANNLGLANKVGSLEQRQGDLERRMADLEAKVNGTPATNAPLVVKPQATVTTTVVETKPRIALLAAPVVSLQYDQVCNGNQCSLVPRASTTFTRTVTVQQPQAVLVESQYSYPVRFPNVLPRLRGLR